MRVHTIKRDTGINVRGRLEPPPSSFAIATISDVAVPPVQPTNTSTIAQRRPRQRQHGQRVLEPAHRVDFSLGRLLGLRNLGAHLSELEGTGRTVVGRVVGRLREVAAS